MTIVVSGFSLPRVDGYSAPAVYGFTLKGQTGPITVQQVENSTIENWYVVDLRIKRRRPVTREEWQLLRQWIAIAKRSNAKYVADLKANKMAERLFAGSFGGRKSTHESGVEQGIRVPYGDPSGLRPAIRAPSRRSQGARGSRRAVHAPARVRGRH